jgi:hypothetical protein
MFKRGRKGSYELVAADFYDVLGVWQRQRPSQRPRPPVNEICAQIRRFQIRIFCAKSAVRYTTKDWWCQERNRIDVIKLLIQQMRTGIWITLVPATVPAQFMLLLLAAGTILCSINRASALMPCP